MCNDLENYSEIYPPCLLTLESSQVEVTRDPASTRGNAATT
jgi:hypothetical protein